MSEEVKAPKIMRQIVLEAALEALIRNGGNRTHACADLVISSRAMRGYISELRSLGYAVPRGGKAKCVAALREELEEYRTGKRRVEPSTKGYCPTCGRIRPSVVHSPA